MFSGLKKSTTALATLATLAGLSSAQVYADTAIGIEGGYHGERTRESDSSEETANYGEVRLRVNLETADSDGMAIKARTTNKVSVGLGRNNADQSARYLEVDSKAMLALETPKLGPVKALIAVNTKVDYRRANAAAPIADRFRPVVSGGIGVRVQAGIFDLTVVPEVGVNLMNQAPVVGGRAILDLDRVITQLTMQYEFAKDFNAENSDLFFIELETGVRLMCLAGGGKKQQVAQGLCLSLYGEVEYWKYNRATKLCGACGTTLKFRDETAYGGGLRFSF